MLSKWNLVKFGQMLVWQTFPSCFGLSAGNWELVLGPLMIWQYAKIWPHLTFNRCHLTFFIVPYSTFKKKKKKKETLESWRNWLLSIWDRLLNWERSGASPQYSKLFNRSLKILAITYFYQVAKFGDLTHFGPVSHFNTPWKRQKTKSIEMWHLTKMG